MNARSLSRLDQLFAICDDALRTVYGPEPRPERANPADQGIDTALAAHERELSGRLMRVNHAGEICAQALYRGHAVTAHSSHVQETMNRAAAEENDHLAWTHSRLHELKSHPSYANPLWYVGSFAIGALAGIAGDKWSLGFVAETERQVVEHLDQHLTRLPQNDEKSRAILEQMRDDESHHATVAIETGAASLPGTLKRLMRFTARIMTHTAYWL